MRLLRRLPGSDVWGHGALVFAAFFVLNVGNYVFYALAGRTLTIGGFGEFMSLVALVIIVAAPALVFQNVLGKIVADVASAGHEDAIASIARGTERFALVVAAAILVAAAVLHGPIVALLHVSDPSLIALSAAAACCGFVLPLLRGILQGASRFGDLAGSMLFEGFARIAFVVPFARIAGVRGAIAALVCSQLFPAIAAAIRLRLVWRGTSGSFDARRAWRAAAGTGAGFFAIMLMLYFDVVLVRHYFPADVAGLYSGVALIGRAIFTGVAFVPMVAIPKIVARNAAGASVRPVAALGIAVALGASVVAIGLVVLVPHRVLAAVGGAGFLPAAPWLLPYATAASALAAANIVVAIRVGLHRFTHVVPLVVVAFAEIAIVATYHATIEQVLLTILCGHASALIATVAVTFAERRARSAPV